MAHSICSLDWTCIEVSVAFAAFSLNELSLCGSVIECFPLSGVQLTSRSFRNCPTAALIWIRLLKSNIWIGEGNLKKIFKGKAALVIAPGMLLHALLLF